jgi:hypothetical protein
MSLRAPVRSRSQSTGSTAPNLASDLHIAARRAESTIHAISRSANEAAIARPAQVCLDLPDMGQGQQPPEVRGRARRVRLRPAQLASITCFSPSSAGDRSVRGVVSRGDSTLLVNHIASPPRTHSPPQGHQRGGVVIRRPCTTPSDRGHCHPANPAGPRKAAS